MFEEVYRAGIPAPRHFAPATLLLLLATGFTLPVDATTVAGRTPGSFAVSPTGAATYTIPIWAPPGPNGMQPQIALSYNSQQDNGYVGVGWGLSGLSSIYRCNLTFAQDAAPAPVALVTTDGYCLDGQRLRLTSGTYGVAGSTYQTEVANFVNVTAYGTAGNGPSYWVAQDRNGKTYSYGNSTSSRVLATGSSSAVGWMLNEVSDPYSNTMTIAYSQTTGTAVPTTISWTPASHGSSTYNYTMTFSYGTNVVPLQGYVAGTSFENSNLLGSITVAYSGTTVKKYVLTYQASATTGRDNLAQVQECSDSAGTNCLLPTALTYQAPPVGISSTATSTPITTAKTLYAHYDFNGDGYQDLLFSNGTTWYVAFGSASGYGTPVSTGISASTAVSPGNILGNGTDGILANKGGTWYYYTWNGSGFSSVSTGLAYDSTASAYVLADVDGDGRPDLVASYVNTALDSVKIYTRLNTSTGTTPSFSTSTTLAYSISPPLPPDDNLTGVLLASNTDGQYGNLRSFDFNGDGRQDLVLETYVSGVTKDNFHGNVTTYELLSTTTGFTATQIDSVSIKHFVPLTFLNFNSDACTDYLSVVSNTIYISGCNGSLPATIALPAGTTVIGAMDWNGDGRTDVLVQNGSTVGVYLSTGSGLGSLQTTSIPYSSSTTYFTFDANGDGLDDLGYMTSTGTIGYYKHNGAGQPPDLVTSVVDGFGNSATPTYVSLVGSANYENYSDATYPYENYIGPMYVVNKATFSDPSSSSGGTYNQTYYYYGAWTNLQGRGWQSFYAYQWIDSRNGLNYLRYFERAFPYTGMDFEDRVYNGTFDLSTTVNTLASLVTLSSTQYQQRYFAYFENSTNTRHESGGTENSELITTASTNYTLDNYGNPTSIATTITDNDPNSPYLNQTWTTTITNTPDESTNPWCLSLLSTSQVAYTASGGGTPVTINKTYTPNTTDCNYTQIVTQPNTSFQVTEALGYDPFGNVNDDSITGTGMAARATTINWGTTGQFPIAVTDPSGATTTRTYTSAQSLGFGVPDSMKDPNTLTTSWLYDGFGRKTQETRPDGTYGTWAYTFCSADGDCLFGNNTMSVTYQLQNTDASIQQRRVTNYDQAGRKFLDLQLMLGGSYNRNELRYDSLGRIGTQYFPCVWTVATSLCPYYTTNTYDVLNRLTQLQRPISSTNSTLQTTTYAYAGRTTTVTDPQSNARTLIKDVNRWLRQTKDPMGYNVTLAYDAAGNKTSTTDSLGNTLWSGTYDYGVKAFLATATDNDMGAWTFTPDAMGEVTGWTDAKGQSFSETYDALSRPLTRIEPDLFTQWTWGSSASSHNIGKLQSVCTGTGSNPTTCTATPGYSEAETYDSLGRLSQRAITLPGTYGGTFTYTWAYSPTTGLLNTLTYPASYPSTYALQLQYGYANGILQTVSDVSDTPNVTVWTANTMDPAGHVTQETLGNGIVTNRTYDAVTQWLGTAQSGVSGGSGVKNLSFLYDEMGNVTQRQDNNLGLTENIYYDNDYRFSYSKLNGTQNLSVSYDGKGNITSRSDVAGGATWTYGTSQVHAVTQAGSSVYQYTYDSNGNATSRQGSSITWSSYNYPTTVNAGSGSTAESVALNYGPDRQRWQQTYTGNSTTEITDYVDSVMEVVTSGGVTNYRHYINAGGENVAVCSRQSNGTDTFSYMLSDHQASVASITNSSGAQVVGESFDAFGNRRNPATWSGPDSNTDLTTIAGITRQGYTFQTALGLWMGMNHMNGRVQDSITGRMLSADPHVPAQANSQSYNRYSYANNNPVTYADPSGFSTCGLTCRRNADGGSEGFGRLFAQEAGYSSLGGGIGGVDGLNAFDVTNCEGCSTGSNIGNGLSQQQETNALATSGNVPLSGANQTPGSGPSVSGPGNSGPGVSGPGSAALNALGDQITASIMAPISDAARANLTLPSLDSNAPEGGYWSDVGENWLATNAIYHGTGTGSITASGTSAFMWDGNASLTWGAFVRSGFQGATIGAATLTPLETGILVIASSVYNVVPSTIAYEGAALGGSMISALPIPFTGGTTVRQAVGNFLYNQLGPVSPYNGYETRCYMPVIGCGP